MQRSHHNPEASAAGGTPETPAELIARIAAEHRADMGSTGRHGAVAVLPPRTRRRARDEDDAPAGHGIAVSETGRHGAPDPVGGGSGTGRHGVIPPAAATGRRRRAEAPAGPAVVEAAAAPPVVDPADAAGPVVSAPAPSLAPHTGVRRTGGRRRRRAAPGRGKPDRGSLDRGNLDRGNLDRGNLVTRDVEATGRSRGRRLAPLAVGALVVVLATLVATTVRPDPGPEPELSAALVDQPPVLVAPDEGSGSTVPPPVEPSAPESVGAVTPGDGAQVVEDVDWTPAGGDDFTTGLGPDWTVYDQDGRSPDAVSVENGVLTLRGDAAGRTGGVAWTEGSRFGRWEMRARFPAGDPRYHPVLLLWPTDVEWPGGGEIDFAETAGTSDRVQFFLHHGADNSQLYAERALDVTQWHDYAVEWTENRVTGYVDGQKWFESTDPNTLPPGNMQAVVQLDWFPGDDPTTGPAAPTEMQVDHVRLYT